jgi:hypothetical protein
LVSTPRPRAPRALTLDVLENAFLGSDFFPLRTPRGELQATKDGVIHATVRLVGNAIIVEQVGRGKAAEARAERVAALFKDRAESARTAEAAGTHPMCAGGCGKPVQRGGIVHHREDGSSVSFHRTCFKAQEGLSPDAKALIHEWKRVGLPGEPRAERDGTLSVAVERWGVRVFYHPVEAAGVLREFPDAEEASDEAEERMAEALGESYSGALDRSEALRGPEGWQRRRPR